METEDNTSGGTTKDAKSAKGNTVNFSDASRVLSKVKKRACASRWGLGGGGGGVWEGGCGNCRAPVSTLPHSPTPPLPELILIDGGKGQLNAACAELAKLGLGHIPVIGLAKEFEEIYRPGQNEPLRLDHGSGALKLLQRVRDESHRVANSYNAQLRIKRISESVLDEFPGIGGARKAALLKKFGSVQRLRVATVEQIAEVPGFGGKAAAELKAFLEARTTLSRAGEGAADVPPGDS